MSVSFVAGSTRAYSAAATSISANAPSGITSGDILLAAVASFGAGFTPSGWTKIAETGIIYGNYVYNFLKVYRKNIASESDAGASFTFSQDAADPISLVYAVVRGADSIAETATATVQEVATWQITPASLAAAADGEMLICFASQIQAGGTVTPSVPSSFTLFSGTSLSSYLIAGAYRSINTGQSNSGSFDFYPGAGAPSPDNGLGAITIRLEPTAGPSTVDARASAVGPLGDAALLARMGRSGVSLAPSMLVSPTVLALHDFTEAVEGQPLAYVMDLTTPSGTVRLPISSWQATLQTEQSNYLQCVVPACLPYVDDINAATAFTISRRATLGDGSAFEYPMAAAPLSNASMAQGTSNYSATLSGYSTGSVVDEDPPTGTDRVLQGVRTIFTQPSGIRVRCAVDWLLRPAQRAHVNGTPFIVSYINYYVSDGDQYMDVGERVEPA